MVNITGIIIAKNEEDRIADCIDSLSFCNEVIVVDGGSSDNTVEIVKKMKAKVIICETNNYAEMRNKGLLKAEGEWILYLDADERIPTKLQEEIISTVNTLDKNNVYKLRRDNYYFGNYFWPYQEQLERLFKKTSIKKWEGKLHESPVYVGSIGVLSNPFVHYSHRDLSSMVSKTNKWSDIEAKLRFDAKHPEMTWWRFPRVIISAFLNSYITQGGWKIGTAGLIESIYQAFSIFITYAKLWELQQKKK